VATACSASSGSTPPLTSPTPARPAERRQLRTDARAILSGCAAELEYVLTLAIFAAGLGLGRLSGLRVDRTGGAVIGAAVMVVPV
jgi:hypothetical protein